MDGLPALCIIEGKVRGDVVFVGFCPQRSCYNISCSKQMHTVLIILSSAHHFSYFFFYTIIINIIRLLAYRLHVYIALLIL